MDVSIVIPALDEELKIGNDIIEADKFLKIHNLDGEIIVVDDGSHDNTFKVASEISNHFKLNCILLRNDSNEGKGSAVKKGIAASKGKFVLYADAGYTVPFANSLNGMDLIKSGQCQFAFGSRKLPDSHITAPQDWDRKLFSKILFATFKIMFDIPGELTDTQCGFKLYEGIAARDLFSQLHTNGFLFEIEIILLAQREGVKIKEFPVEWKCDRDSRLSFVKSSIPIVKEILDIKRLYK